MPSVGCMFLDEILAVLKYPLAFDLQVHVICTSMLDRCFMSFTPVIVEIGDMEHAENNDKRYLCSRLNVTFDPGVRD